jgi:hypothetical protein
VVSAWSQLFRESSLGRASLVAEVVGSGKETS